MSTEKVSHEPNMKDLHSALTECLQETISTGAFEKVLRDAMSAEKTIVVNGEAVTVPDMKARRKAAKLYRELKELTQ
jgi:hypothetical protein